MELEDVEYGDMVKVFPVLNESSIVADDYDWVDEEYDLVVCSKLGFDEEDRCASVALVEEDDFDDSMDKFEFLDSLFYRYDTFTILPGPCVLIAPMRRWHCEIAFMRY